MFHNSIALISSNIIDMIVCVSVCSDIGNYHWETNMFKQLREQSPRCPLPVEEKVQVEVALGVEEPVKGKSG